MTRIPPFQRVKIKMRFSSILLVVAASAANAQRPANESICDYYTKALLKQNTAENQLTLLTLLVNTVVIGNCTSFPPRLTSLLSIANSTVSSLQIRPPMSASKSPGSLPQAISTMRLSTFCRTSTVSWPRPTLVALTENRSTSSMVAAQRRS